MSSNIVLSFAMLFGATIALICAVYLFLGMRRRQKERLSQSAKHNEEPEENK